MVTNITIKYVSTPEKTFQFLMARFVDASTSAGGY